MDSRLRGAIYAANSLITKSGEWAKQPASKKKGERPTQLRGRAAVKNARMLRLAAKCHICQLLFKSTKNNRGLMPNSQGVAGVLVKPE